MLDLIEGFPEQWEKGWEMGEKKSFFLPEKLSNIVVLGMGGSAIGGDILQALSLEKSKKPVFVNRDYTIPTWIGESSLVIAVSYSGNTEETLSALEIAKNLGATVWGISSGGTLSERMGENYLKIPSGLPPRAALGYTLAPVLALLEKGNLIDFSPEEKEETLRVLEEIKTENISGGPAKLLAEQLKGSIPLIYGPGALGGVAARRWKCQINENSKSPCFWAEYPELNHNEMVGWDEPQELLNKIRIVHLLDYAAHPRNQKRMEITGELLQKKGIKVSLVHSRGKYPLTRVLSLIFFGDFVSYYLATSYGVDPVPVELIESLKEQLKKVD